AATTGDQTQVLDSKDGSASAAAGVTAATAHAAAAAAGGQSQVSFGGTKAHVRTDVRTAGSQTMMGSIMGTPAYMPPEQAKGKLDEIDARADIYSLGGILYKLLTNQQPIKRGKNIKELLKRVIDGEIIPPRQHEASVDKPLEAICLKALATKRGDRYQSALDIVQDVEAFLADEPVSCFDDPPLVKARRWGKKNQRTVVGVSTTLAAGLVFFIGSSLVHSSTLSGIRSFAAEQLKSAEDSADKGEFENAATALNEAIGRAGSEPDLAELKSSLENQLALFEQTRVQQLEADSNQRLQVALADFRSGEFGKARTSLAETLVMIGDEESLAEIKTKADTLLTRIEGAIAQQSEIDATQNKFEQFRTLADEARARGSMPGAANEREDAQIALAAAAKALKLFGLDKSQAFDKPPAWFGEDLPWVVEFQLRTGKLPLAELKNDAFELMILLADLELFLAKDGTQQEITAAANRGLSWVKLAKGTGAVSPVPFIWEARCHRFLGDNAAADSALAESRKIKPTTALDFFLLGDADRKSGRYDNALVNYLNVLRIDGGHYWTQHFMGLCYLKLDVHHAAVSAFSNAASLRENYAWPIMLRGVAHGRLGMYEQAMADFEAAIAIDPDLFNIYINRGVISLQMGRHADALADFRKAAQLAPQSPVSHINIAAWHVDEARRIREGDGEFEETPDVQRVALEATVLDAALSALDAAEKVGNAAKNPGIVALRAKIAMQQGNFTVALDLFAKHAQLAPTRADLASSQKRIGFLQYRLGKYDLAIAAFEKADKAVSDDPETIYMLGECHLQMRDSNAALKYYLAFDALAHKKLRSEINRPEALYTGIATALNMLGRRAEAIEYYTLAIKNNPNLAAALKKRGWAYAMNGLQLAKADFENARQQNNQDGDTRIGLGFTLAKLGDWSSAEKELLAGVEQSEKQLTDAENQKDDETLARGWILFFNAATGFAQAFESARADSSVPTTERQAVAGRLYQSTIDQLKESVDRATRHRQVASVVRAMETDDQLNPVRKLSGFQNLLRDARAAAARGATVSPNAADSAANKD
ncbi:MAG: tetratricopeptide repeat protein, partial [Planctomycetes bacterium]|nr:tetratricopeptide repeat protein [Planctomycetota bacterium]